jgi:hypothetical protein
MQVYNKCTVVVSKKGTSSRAPDLLTAFPSPRFAVADSDGGICEPRPRCPHATKEVPFPDCDLEQGWEDLAAIFQQFDEFCT